MIRQQTNSAPGSMAVDAIVPAAWEACSYLLDAAERWTLFLSAMQQRAERYREHTAKSAPHVLKFDCELVTDGRKLPRPVNYALVRINPPQGVELNETKRPFVVVDPRAGHGPGIGGFKAESEIGVIFKAGHACYFIGFLPEPVPGQTIEDVVQATAIFIETVGRLHPDSEGRPAIVGNCQAGWSVMMAAARQPGLFGPLIVAGSPLSYWAGVRGENPMRYTGGLLGGSWLTALMGDLGNGKFDGAWLVGNFENLNPANTYWTKHYNLYSKIDTEAPRYLEFEQWWGGHVLMNAREMQFIVDELFVGNKLAAAEVAFSDGTSIDLREISSPIVVFCSKADNITPPPQALGWITDLYENVEDIRARGQTIVYAVHESAGHLGIFVSGSVAKKEHHEFASNIDLIDVLPPGLYEAVMIPKDGVDGGPDLVGGDYLVRFEARTLDDIRALGSNSEEDERQFAAVSRLSDINLGLYRTFIQPWVRLCANEAFASATRRYHPLRLQYEYFSRANPFVPDLAPIAENIGRNRHPVSGQNWPWQVQEAISQGIESSLDAYRDVRDHFLEALFHGIYGSPAMQALTGLKASDASPRRRPTSDAMHKAFVARRREELKQGIAEGGPREATIRALLYIRMPDGVADERGFRLIQQMREDAGSGLTISAFKKLVRDQFFMLITDECEAVEAIPAMLARDPEFASRLMASMRRLIKIVGLQSAVGKARLAEMEAVFEASRDVRGARRAGGAGDSPAAAKGISPALAAAAPGRDRHR